MKELEIAKEVALKAGNLIMTYYKREDLKVSEKGGMPENYLTEADEASEKLIYDELMNAFPDYGFIGEETFDGKQINKEYIWIVDPIDGTKGFVNHTDHFGVHIGLARNHEAILGVVYLPVFKKLFWAEKGKGAYMNNKPIHVSKTNKINEMTMGVSPRITHDSKLKAIFEKIKVKQTFLADAVAYKSCMIAEGSSDITFFKEIGVHEWDVCAPQVILEEAGGKITGLNNEKITYNKEKTNYDFAMLLSNNKAHQELLDILNS